jgi:pimeloyl-ACP methyl ester carboxylesterase
MIIWGDDDRIVSIDHGRRLAGAIPGRRFVVVPKPGIGCPKNSPGP